ncbi:MAG: nitroreductase family protein, partial [Actinobacteria bacterium]|nr:nitroreductase family protein [Actinomycetota bacterium]
VMENMWIMATSLGIGFQIMSVFGAEAIEKEIKQILNIPKYLKIAFAFRLGYPSSKVSKYLRVRRNVEDFTHITNSAVSTLSENVLLACLLTFKLD